MTAIAIWRGPQHILVDGNDVQRGITPQEAWGVPAREIFNTQVYAETLDAMDLVYETGEPMTLYVESSVMSGTYTITPLVGGLATLWRQRSPQSQRRRVLRLDEHPRHEWRQGEPQTA